MPFLDLNNTDKVVYSKYETLISALPINKSKVTQSSIEFTHEPTDELIIERLLDGHQDVFLRATQQSVSVDKQPEDPKIFICDYTYRYMSPESRELDFLLYNWMLKQNFEIYVWTGKGSVPVERYDTLEGIRQAVLRIPIENSSYIHRKLNKIPNRVFFDYATIQTYVKECFSLSPNIMDIWPLPHSMIVRMSWARGPAIALSEFDMTKPGVDDGLAMVLTGAKTLILTRQQHMLTLLTNPQLRARIGQVESLIISAIDGEITIPYVDLMVLINACAKNVVVVLYGLSIENFRPLSTPPQDFSTILMNVKASPECLAALKVGTKKICVQDENLSSVRLNNPFHYILNACGVSEPMRQLSLAALMSSLDKQQKAQSESMWTLGYILNQVTLRNLTLADRIQPAMSPYLQQQLALTAHLKLEGTALTMPDLLAITASMSELYFLEVSNCPTLFCENQWQYIEQFFSGPGKAIVSLKIVSAGENNAFTCENMQRILDMLPSLTILTLHNVNFMRDGLKAGSGFTHPRLHTVTTLDCNNHNEWLNWLSCEQLTTLHVNRMSKSPLLSSAERMTALRWSEDNNLFLYGPTAWPELIGSSMTHPSLHEDCPVFGPDKMKPKLSDVMADSFADRIKVTELQTEGFARYDAHYPQLVSLRASTHGTFELSPKSAFSNTEQKKKASFGHSPTATIQETIDVNTDEPEHQLDVNQYFIGPQAGCVTRTRLEVKIAQGDEALDQIELVDPSSYERVENAADVFERLTGRDQTIRLGVVESFELSAQWRPLPADTPCDVLTHVQCAVDCDLGYNRAKSKFFLKAKDPQFTSTHLDIGFLVIPARSRTQYDYYNCAPAKVCSELVEAVANARFTDNLQLEKNQAYDRLMSLEDRDKIMAVRRHIDFFQPKGVAQAANSDPDHLKLNAMNMLRAGACRHRAILGYYLLRGLGIKVRRIENRAHSFCEIQLEGNWYSLDLGGAPTNLNIHQPKRNLSRWRQFAKVVNAVVTLPVTLPIWFANHAMKTLVPSSFRQRFTPWGGSQQTHEKQHAVVFAQDKPILAEATATRLHPVVDQDKNPQLNLGYVALPQDVTSLSTLVEYVGNNAVAQQLLVFDQSAHLDYFAVALQQQYQYQQKNASVFYLSSLDDLSLQALVVEGEHYHIGDSHLVHFLKQAQAGDVLLVNWSDFRSENVGYYSMADDVRSIKRFHIPEGVRLVCVTTEASLAYYGDAFTSRFQHKIQCPSTLSVEATRQPESIEKDLESCEIIDLNTSRFWKSQLIGRVVFSGNRVAYQQGALTQALSKQPTEIVLLNPPDSADFERFLQRLKVARCFFANGRRIRIAPTVQFSIREQTPVWHSEQITFEYATSGARATCDEVMNLDTFDQFFRQRRVIQPTLHESVGLLSQHPHLRVYLDCTLTVFQWAALQSELAKTPENTLHLVGRPAVFQHLPAQAKPFKRDALTQETIAEAAHQLVQSDDVAWAANELYQTDKQHRVVLRVTTRTQASALIGQTQVSYQSGAIVFAYQEGALVRAMQQGQTAIIAGEFTASMLNQLAPLFCKTPHLWVNGQRFEPKTGCFLLANRAPYTHCPSVQEKVSPLVDDWPLYQTLVRAQEHLSVKQVLEKIELVNQSNFPEMPCLPADADVNAIRLNSVRAPLSHQPALLLLGHTGAGKSWFVRNILFAEADIHGFEGLARLRNWALCRDDTARYIILHLDEVNLLPKRVLDCLMGLFSAKPHILIGSEYIELTPKHKLLGSGNPPSYGGRDLHPLWKNQVMAEVFAPLSPTFVAQHILSLQQNTEAASVFAKVYRLLFEQNVATPRNAINMMMQLELALQQAANAEHLSNTIRRCALDEVAAITSDAAILQQTIQLLGGEPEPLAASIDWSQLTSQLAQLGYVLAPEHRPALLALHHQIGRRDLALSAESWVEASSRAVIVQGASGIGKSAMVMGYLAVKGYQPLAADDLDALGTHAYAYLSSADFHDIEARLLDAFHAGMPVVIEEINTLPQQAERVLNTLLSGTDLSGEPAKRPGFMVIGTQNPPEHYAGRHPQSKAFINRCQVIDLPDYTKASLVAVVQRFGIGRTVAQQLVEEYSQKREQAVANHSLIVPTPRDLFRALKDPQLCRRLRRRQNEVSVSSWSFFRHRAFGGRDEMLTAHVIQGKALGLSSEKY